MNLLYYGDNLEVLPRYIEDVSVDLIYLDPPFKSDQNYNVLFQELDGTRARAQIKAFNDTWRWDQEAARLFEETVEAGGKVSQVLQAFRSFLGPSDMLAYLARMAPTLKELRRVLKPTGSLFLHCDPAASHYLKLLLDAVFTPVQFRSEIIWRRTGTTVHGALVQSTIRSSSTPRATTTTSGRFFGPTSKATWKTTSKRKTNEESIGPTP